MSLAALSDRAVVLAESATALLLAGAVIYLYRRLQTVRAQRDQLRQEKDVIFGFMHDVGEVFAGGEAVTSEALLNRVLFYALRTSRASAGAIYLFEGEGDELRARAVSGVFPPLTETILGTFEAAGSKSRYIEQIIRSRPVRRGEGLIGQVADLGAPVLIQDAETDPRVPRHEVDYLRIRSALLVPLRYQQQMLGVLAVVNRVDGRAFNESDESLLRALADQASASVHYAGVRAVLAEKKRIDHDLAVAQQIQASLLPKQLPQWPGLELGAFNAPARQVGGDYYDVVQVDANHLGLVIADVAGKGIGGALLMSVCRSVLRATAPGTLSPAAVLRTMNRILNPDIGDDMFVTLLYMILRIDTLELTVARAGHERPLLIGRDGTLKPIEGSGPAIGMVDDDLFDSLIREATVRLEPGDTLVAYTDGVTDAMNAAGEEWGFDRFSAACRLAAPKGAAPLVEAVRTEVERFVGDHPRYDDMTLLALRKIG